MLLFCVFRLLKFFKVGMITFRNKTQKRVHALNRELPPPNEQFILDFEQLQSQFPVSLKLYGAIFVVLALVCFNLKGNMTFYFILEGLSD